MTFDASSRVNMRSIAECLKVYVSNPALRKSMQRNHDKIIRINAVESMRRRWTYTGCRLYIMWHLHWNPVIYVEGLTRSSTDPSSTKRVYHFVRR